MDGFRNFLYGYLVENDFIDEDGDTTVEDLSVEYIMGETDADVAIVEDAWFEYLSQCESIASEPINDVEDFTPPY